MNFLNFLPPEIIKNIEDYSLEIVKNEFRQKLFYYLYEEYTTLFGLKHGEYKKYNHHKCLIVKSEWLNGIIQNEKVYRDNGSIKFELLYKNKVPIKKLEYKSAYKKIRIQNYFYYLQDRYNHILKNGTETKFYKNNNIRSQIEYLNGVRVYSKEFYKTGELLSKKQYKNGFKSGYHIGYTKNGDLLYCKFFNKNKRVFVFYEELKSYTGEIFVRKNNGPFISKDTNQELKTNLKKEPTIIHVHV